VKLWSSVAEPNEALKARDKSQAWKRIEKRASQTFRTRALLLITKLEATGSIAHQYDNSYGELGKGQNESKDGRQWAHQSCCVLPSN
jgi:hypothetical protein